MPYDEDRGIVLRFNTGYNLANLSSATIKVLKADGSVNTTISPTVHDEANGVLSYTSSTSTDELADYVGANSVQAELIFASGEIYHTAVGTFTISEVLIPTPVVTGSVTQANLRVNATDGSAFLDFSSGVTLTDYEDKYIIVYDSNGFPIKGWIKNPGVTETLGDELATGTLTTGVQYKITATTANHFGTGLIVGSYFTACDDETCTATDKVKPVTTPASTGVTIVSAKYGTTYNWVSKHVDFNYKDISGGYTYAIYSKATPTA